MKKVLVLILIVVGFAACNNDSDNDKPIVDTVEVVDTVAVDSVIIED